MVTSVIDADSAGRRRSLTRLDSLTSLRFFAAFAVVVQHAGWMWTTRPWAGTVFDLGYVAVSFFFVLSGFVLTWSWTPERTRGRFWWLRFARIWPLHALTAAAAGLFVAGIWVPGPGGLAAIATGTQAFSPHERTYYGLNGVSWSLSCEAFFYLLFPFLAPLLVRRGPAALCRLAALVTGYLLLAPLLAYTLAADPRSWVQQHAEWLFFVDPLYRLGEFVVGAVVASAFRRGWRPALSLPQGALGAAATTAVVAWLEHADGTRLARPFFALLMLPWIALVVAAAAGGDVAGRRGLLTARPLVFLGEASFALYLTHQLVQRAVDWSALVPGHPHSSTALFGLYVATSLVVAALTHVWVEQPIERRLRARRIGLRPAHRPGPRHEPGAPTRPAAAPAFPGLEPALSTDDVGPSPS